MKHGYLQQVHAPKSSNSEILEQKKGLINRLVTIYNAFLVPNRYRRWLIESLNVCRSGVALPSSLSGDETEESSSSMD